MDASILWAMSFCIGVILTVAVPCPALFSFRLLSVFTALIVVIFVTRKLVPQKACLPRSIRQERSKLNDNCVCDGSGNRLCVLLWLCAAH